MLAKVVSSEIVPRLMMMQHNGGMGGAAQPVMDAQCDLAEFIRSLLAQETSTSQAFFEALERRGVEPKTILLEFFAPAARRLGELWTADQCDFVQVSIGLHRLQSFMDDLCSHWGAGLARHPNPPRILLLTAPGETHEFGVAMVGNFFRAEGWRVTASSPANVLHQIHSQSYQVMGVSVSCTRYLAKLRELIADARRLSRNSSVRVIVGGQLFMDDPSLAVELGADGAAVDAQDAVQLARSLLDADLVCESPQTNAVSI
jgi:methanogenic corrinoid protein MtbC1